MKCSVTVATLTFLVIEITSSSSWTLHNSDLMKQDPSPGPRREKKSSCKKNISPMADYNAPDERMSRQMSGVTYWNVWPSLKSATIKQENNQDRWVWGLDESATQKKMPDSTPDTLYVNNNTFIEDTTEKQFRDPICNKILLPMPDFKAPGKRIAVQKCEEYLWKVNRRIDLNLQGKKCEEPGTFHTEEVGGRDAEPGEFPHMGAIGWKAAIGTWVFKCGGTLISSKFVLTAAHCTKASPRDTDIADIVPKVIRFGDKNILDDENNDFPPITSNIINIITHPTYKPPKQYNDIALMELDYDIRFKKSVQPACLWHQFDTTPLGTKATSTGWGVVKASGHEGSPILQVTELDIIDSKKCDDLLRPNCNRRWCGIEDTQICAGVLKGGVDACQGDSGGPLQVQIPLSSTSEGAMHYVIGVTSFGFGCAEKNTPGVYTRVSQFIDWIENQVWKDDGREMSSRPQETVSAV